jgi:hypothetical protein
MDDIESDFDEYYNCQRFDNTTCLYTGKEYKAYDEDISGYSINNENDMDKTEKVYNIEMLKTGFTFEENNEESIPASEPKDQENSHLFINDNIEDKKQSAKNNKKGLGRKSKNSKDIGIHNKYSEDNILRKIKSTLLSYLYNFINFSIYTIYEGNIKKGLFKRELKKINQSQVVDTRTNKEFLHKTLKEIFSDNISTKYSYYSNDYNKNLIEELLNESDYEKRIKFKRLFSLTFLDCLMHFRGNKIFDELKGLESFNKYKEKFEDDEEYLYLFEYYISHFEEIIIKKRHRNRKK